MNIKHWPRTLVMAGLVFFAYSCQSPQQAGSNKTATAPAVPQAQEPANDAAFSGEVVHADMKTHLLTVKSATDQKSFIIGRKTKVITETSTHGALSTLNRGDLVEVEYEQQGDSSTATRVVRKAVAAGQKPAPQVERLEKMLNPDPNNPYKTD